jgi:hypothetical protein
VILCDRFASPDERHNSALLPRYARYLARNGSVKPRPAYMTIVQDDIRAVAARAGMVPVDLVLSRPVFEHPDDVEGKTDSLVLLTTPGGMSGPAPGWQWPMIRSDCQHSSRAAAGARMRAMWSSPIEISGPGCSATWSRCFSPPGSRPRISVPNRSIMAEAPRGRDRVDRSPNLYLCYHMAHRSERANKRA